MNPLFCGLDDCIDTFLVNKIADALVIKHPADFFSCILQQPEIYPVKGRDKLKLLVMGFLEGLAYDFSFLKDVKRNFVVS